MRKTVSDLTTPAIIMHAHDDRNVDVRSAVAIARAWRGSRCGGRRVRLRRRVIRDEDIRRSDVTRDKNTTIVGINIFMMGDSTARISFNRGGRGRVNRSSQRAASATSVPGRAVNG